VQLLFAVPIEGSLTPTLSGGEGVKLGYNYYSTMPNKKPQIRLAGFEVLMVFEIIK
jgi:hypothetical protein